MTIRVMPEKEFESWTEEVREQFPLRDQRSLAERSLDYLRSIATNMTEAKEIAASQQIPFGPKEGPLGGAPSMATTYGYEDQPGGRGGGAYGGYFLSSAMRRTLGPQAGQIGYGAYGATRLAGMGLAPGAAAAGGAAMMIPALVQSLIPKDPQSQAQAMLAARQRRTPSGMEEQAPTIGALGAQVKLGAGLVGRMFQPSTVERYRRGREDEMGYGQAAAELEYRQGVSGMVEQGKPASQAMMGGVTGAAQIGEALIGGARDPLQAEQWGATLMQYAPLVRLGVPMADILQGVVSGDLEELTGKAGFDFQRMMQGDRHIWSQMSRAGVEGAPRATMEEGGLAWGTTQMWGLQDQQRQTQRGYQQWQFQQRGEGLAETQAYTEERWGVEAEQRESQRGMQRTRFGWQGQDIERGFGRGMTRLNESLEDLNTHFQRAERGAGIQQQMTQMRFGQQMTQFGWAGEDIQRGRGRSRTQFGWGREDIAYQGAQQSMQYGWGQEDIQEQMRYATGRQRRQLMKQQQRQTVQYAMGAGRLETQEGRLGTREGWAEEDFAIAERRNNTRKQWATEIYQLQLRQMQETKNWRMEDYQKELSRIMERRSWLEEDHTTDLERHGISVGHWEEQVVFQDELITLQQDYWTAQHERQEEALEKQQEIWKIQKDIEDSMIKTQRDQALRTAEWNKFWSEGGAFANALQSILGFLTSGYDLVRHYTWPGAGH